MTGLEVFVMLLLISMVVYLVGGMCLLNSRGATGLEMIPNYTMFSNVCKKAQEGLAYCANGCKPREEGYEAI